MSSRTRSGDAAPESESAPRSLQLGCNAEIQHRGRTFHVQTEDSGVDRPRVITHLFAGGGRIVATRRSDYTAAVGTSRFREIVRELVRLQHRDMCERLRRGEYDDILGARASGASAPREEPPIAMSMVVAVLEARDERNAVGGGAPASRRVEVAPPPASRSVLRSPNEAVPPSSSRHLELPQIVLLEDTSALSTALDVLIAEQVAAQLTDDES